MSPFRIHIRPDLLARISDSRIGSGMVLARLFVPDPGFIISIYYWTFDDILNYSHVQLLQCYIQNVFRSVVRHTVILKIQIKPGSLRAPLRTEIGGLD